MVKEKIRFKKTVPFSGMSPEERYRLSYGFNSADTRPYSHAGGIFVSLLTVH